jgi:hypothetical protein
MENRQLLATAISSILILSTNSILAKAQIPHHLDTPPGNTIGRGFCPNCGSWLFSKPANPELMGITAGCLDDPSEFQPAMDIYTASAQPWNCMNPDLLKFEKMPSFNN